MEACIWYDTIRKRQYFKPERPSETELLQQLRYFMRFALVCILLQDIDKVRHVSRMLRASQCYKPMPSCLCSC